MVHRPWSWRCDTMYNRKLSCRWQTARRICATCSCWPCKTRTRRVCWQLALMLLLGLTTALDVAPSSVLFLHRPLKIFIFDIHQRQSQSRFWSNVIHHCGLFCEFIPLFRFHRYCCGRQSLKLIETRSSADADNRLDAFSGQSRSTNMVPFHMLHMVSYCAI